MADDRAPAMSQAEVNAIAGSVYVTLSAILPLLSEEQKRQIASGIVGDHLKLQQLLDELVDGQISEWGISLRKKNLVQLAGLDRSDSEVFGFKLSTNPREIKDPNDMVMFATVLAFATSDAARAVIAALGYELRFVRTKVQSTPTQA